jgi:hypothetical protein
MANYSMMFDHCHDGFVVVICERMLASKLSQGCADAVFCHDRNSMGAACWMKQAKTGLRRN